MNLKALQFNKELSKANHSRAVENCIFKVMSGGAGHVTHMLKTLKGNKNLIRKRGFGSSRNGFNEELQKKKLVFKEATPKQLSEIRTRLKQRNKNKSLLLFYVMVISVVLTYFGFQFVLGYDFVH